MTNFILIAMFGAFVQEFSYWYEKRKELNTDEYKRLITSKEYWIIAIMMVVISGIGTYLLFKDELLGKEKAIFIIGAAFPMIFKKAVKVTRNGEPELGGNHPKMGVENITNSIKPNVIITYFK